MHACTHAHASKQLPTPTCTLTSNKFTIFDSRTSRFDPAQTDRGLSSRSLFVPSTRFRGSRFPARAVYLRCKKNRVSFCRIACLRRSLMPSGDCSPRHPVLSGSGHNWSNRKYFPRRRRCRRPRASITTVVCLFAPFAAAAGCAIRHPELASAVCLKCPQNGKTANRRRPARGVCSTAAAQYLAVPGPRYLSLRNSAIFPLQAYPEIGRTPSRLCVYLDYYYQRNADKEDSICTRTKLRVFLADIGQSSLRN